MKPSPSSAGVWRVYHKRYKDRSAPPAARERPRRGLKLTAVPDCHLEEKPQVGRVLVEGLHRALRVVRRHRLLELFLHRIMWFDLQDLHSRARALESAIDEVFEEKMDAVLGSPRIDPHGQPIPGKNATWPKLGDSLLLELPPGTTGKVSRITTDDADAIKYLHGLGVRPGAVVVLEGVAPFDGPASVRVKGNVVHLGRRLAQALHVTEEGKKKGSGSMKLVGAGTKPDDAR